MNRRDARKRYNEDATRSSPLGLPQTPEAYPMFWKLNYSTRMGGLNILIVPVRSKKFKASALSYRYHR